MKDEVAHRETPAIDTIPIGRLPASGSDGKVAFRIPAYQRGYRWKSEDVKKLLTDLQHFLDHKDDGRSFYCLQPLVVRKTKIISDDEKTKQEVWEVVDGQQRLTTLLLIWKVVNGSATYELSYETRKKSKVFLNDPEPDESGRLPNIDFHHIYHAHLAIQTWFNDDEDLKRYFKDLLADTNPKGRNVRFIWYCLQESDDAVAAFTRLNVGKIPLTDEELIRALFLSSREPGKPADGAFQHRLALEWDRIETSLQEPDFWGFVSNQTAPEGGRIRLLFQLCAPAEIKNDNHALFEHYHTRLAGEHPENPCSVWKEIVACFEQLEEWYRDPELFHLVGYFTTILGKTPTETLRNLIKDVQSPTKQQFASTLRQSIRTELIGEDKAVSIPTFVSERNFGTKPKTRQTLVLFNIATILRTKGVQMRFPFHLYHNTEIGWDIEHAHSQAGDGLKDKSRWKEWLPACIPELQWEAGLDTPPKGKEEMHKGDKTTVPTTKPTPGDLIAEIEAFTKQETETEFTKLVARIRDYFGESPADDEPLQSIGNLTLLDAKTNRSYGNAPFVVKRSEILRAEREGRFLLPCTRDLFLKVFSKNPGNLRRWDIDKDGAAHKAAICETLETFFGEKGGTK